jgi:hypothetical protein
MIITATAAANVAIFFMIPVYLLFLAPGIDRASAYRISPAGPAGIAAAQSSDRIPG